MRRALGRARAALALRRARRRARGDAVRCPLCGSAFAAFRPVNDRPNAVCWSCGSHERHRALWLYVQAHPEVLAGARGVLHLAPEACLERCLRSVAPAGYLTADIDPGHVGLRRVDRGLDLMALALADDSLSVVLCSHVLEHVPDDGVALGELRRVLEPGGRALIMVPVQPGREHTHEDPSVVDPLERRRRFGQEDHMRVYGADVGARLARAGFDVTAERVAATLGPERARGHALFAHDDVFVCVKP